VDNSRRRIETLHALLLSFPGTPVIYYGDEIGMGDNVFLGDRDGVRTPMQWSGDRNAGFSRADEHRLYMPLIRDPVYGYEAVNVEAQERTPTSILAWMRRLIGIRRAYPAFGRAGVRFVNPANPHVVAFLREWEGTVLFCAYNLSRFCQPAELDLSMYQGYRPLELFGRVPFPQIGELPYLLTFGPHAFYWFELQAGGGA
jgi:maltose alpha-D-glucosyltransferase/alpha-amylase